MEKDKDFEKPVYRNKLKGVIHYSGYKSLNDFGADIGACHSLLSRVVNGWLVPSRQLQQKMATGLHIPVKKLRELL